MAPLAWMAAIYFLSAQSSLPSVAAATSDKVQHAGAYALLSVLLLRALAGGRWPGVRAATVLAAVVAAALYGLGDEWHQRSVPGRDADLLDVAADAAGAVFGAGAAWAWGIIRRLGAHS